MPSDPGDVTDARLPLSDVSAESAEPEQGTIWPPQTSELTPDADGVVDLSALREAAVPAGDPLEAAQAAAEDGATLEEILWEYREAILDLHARVNELEARPQFAASVRGRRTGH